MSTGGIAKPDKFDCFRRNYIAGMLADAADAMPARKRREFRRFLKSLPTGSVFDDATKPTAELKTEGGEQPGSAAGFAKHRGPSQRPLGTGL